MMKSLLAANRSEKDSFRIPHSVQQSIPIRRIYTDGIWQVGQKYSKTWRFSDINYAASSLDDRRSIFRSYGAVLNSLPTDATAKITIINRRLNPVDFQRTMLMPECSDGLDYPTLLRIQNARSSRKPKSATVHPELWKADRCVSDYSSVRTGCVRVLL